MNKTTSSSYYFIKEEKRTLKSLPAISLLVSTTITDLLKVSDRAWAQSLCVNV